MDNNRSEILSQLASGQISAEQAAEQLRGPAAPETPLPAPQAPLPTPEAPPTQTPPATPEQQAALANRWLRIRVSDMESGRQRVSVNVPLSWVSYGLKIGARYSPELAGLDANELMAMLQSGANGQVVDVEDADKGEHVQIFIE